MKRTSSAFVKSSCRGIAIFICSAFSVASAQLTTPNTPTVELLGELPEVETLEVTPDAEESSKPQIVQKQKFDTGCPFPSASERHEAVNADVFGPVPRINGVLPANMPIGVPFDGPVEGTEYIRISSVNGNGLHYYSTVQAWNADMTKVMIGDGGVDDNRILDAENNFELLPQRVSLSTDRVWSNVDPDIIYGITGQSTVYKFNVRNGERTELYKRPNGSRISFMGKGAIPDDDSKMVFLARDENVIVSIDLQSSRTPRPVLGELDWGARGNLNKSGMFLNFDHSGKWITMRPPRNGSSTEAVLHRMSPDLKTVESLGQMCCHSDSAVDTNNNSVQAETRWRGKLRVWNFDDKSFYDAPSVVNATPGQSASWFASYVSGRGQLGCGKSWVLLSGEEGEGSPNHPLILYKLDGNANTPTFKAVGGDLHSGAAKTIQSSNLGKQKAVQSPDGNAVIFDSDGGIKNGVLSTYVLRVKK